jgi:hypothetical protein
MGMSGDRKTILKGQNTHENNYFNILSVFTFASSQIDVEADGMDIHAAHNIIREQGYIKHIINSEVQSTVTCTFSDTEDCNLGDMNLW